MAAIYSQAQIVVTFGGRQLTQIAKDGSYSVEPMNDSTVLTEGNGGDSVFNVDIRRGSTVKVQLMPGGADDLFLVQQLKAQRVARVPQPKPLTINDPLSGRQWVFEQATIKREPNTTFALEIGQVEWEFLAVGSRNV